MAPGRELSLAAPIRLPGWRRGGEQSSDRYRMERAIGSGGMGTVWLATDTLLDRPVAIKRLRSEITEDDEARQRILRETRIAARLHDPRIAEDARCAAATALMTAAVARLPAPSPP